MEEILDPQLHQPSGMVTLEDDLFGVEIKPKVETERVKVELSQQDEEMEDLFGDDETVEEPAKAKSPSPVASTGREGSEALSVSEIRHRQELEYEEGEGQDENVVELKHAVLSIPNIPMPRSSDGKYWVMRMPNFVKLDSKPFHPDTYTGSDVSADGVSEREKSMSIKLDVENTIRWRWAKASKDAADESAPQKPQSNSRIIRWSDGSLSLLLGKELFDVNQAYEGASGMPRQTSSFGSLSQTQNTSQGAAPQVSGRGSGLTYLVAQHKRPGILQTEVPVTGFMTLRPTGMQSETHRKLARAVGQKHSRVARLRMADSAVEQDAQEALMAAQKKPRRVRMAGPRENGESGSAPRRRRGGYGRRRESVWSDDEPEVGAFEDSDEEDEADYDASPRKRGTSGEGRGDTDAKRGTGEYLTDDFLVADSSEGEDDFTGKTKRKNKKRRHRSEDNDAEGEEDALEKLDAKIAKQEEDRRRRKQATESQGEDAQHQEKTAEKKESEDVAMDMDVESEEEEDFNVRRTGSGSRKKRAIAFDEDEEE